MANDPILLDEIELNAYGESDFGSAGDYANFRSAQRQFDQVIKDYGLQRDKVLRLVQWGIPGVPQVRISGRNLGEIQSRSYDDMFAGTLPVIYSDYYIERLQRDVNSSMAALVNSLPKTQHANSIAVTAPPPEYAPINVIAPDLTTILPYSWWRANPWAFAIMTAVNPVPAGLGEEEALIKMRGRYNVHEPLPLVPPDVDYVDLKANGRGFDVGMSGSRGYAMPDLIPFPPQLEDDDEVPDAAVAMPPALPTPKLSARPYGWHRSQPAEAAKKPLVKGLPEVRYSHHAAHQLRLVIRQSVTSPGSITVSGRLARTQERYNDQPRRRDTKLHGKAYRRGLAVVNATYGAVTEVVDLLDVLSRSVYIKQADGSIVNARNYYKTMYGALSSLASGQGRLDATGFVLDYGIQQTNDLISAAPGMVTRAAIDRWGMPGHIAPTNSINHTYDGAKDGLQTFLRSARDRVSQLRASDVSRSQRVSELW